MALRIGAMRTDNGIIIFSIGDQAQRHVVRVPQTTSRQLELQAAARRQRRVARTSRRRDQAKEELFVWYRSVEVDVPENSEVVGSRAVAPQAAAPQQASGEVGRGAGEEGAPAGNGGAASPEDAGTGAERKGSEAPRAAEPTSEEGPSVPAPVPAPAVLSDASGGENDNSECAICLESLPGPLPVVFAPRCGHAFHSECLLRVLAFRTYTCPQCRACLIPPELDHLTPLLTAPPSCDTNALGSRGSSTNMEQDAVLEMIANAQAAAGGADAFAVTAEPRNAASFGQLMREQSWMRRTCTRLSLVIVIGLMVLVIFLLVGSSVQYA